MKSSRLAAPRKKGRSSKENGSYRAPLCACAGILLAAAVSTRVVATSYFWDSITNNWSDTTDSTQDWLDNFGGNVIAAPVSAATNQLFFGGSNPYTSTNDLGDGFQLNTITLSSSGATADTIAGNQLSFVSNGAITPTISQNGSGAFNISNNVVLSNNLTLNGSGSGAVTWSGIVSGASALSVASGAWTISGVANTWTGGTAITGGTLTVTNPATNGNLVLSNTAGTAGSLGSTGTITINGGTLQLTTNGTGTLTSSQPYAFGTAGGTLNLSAVLVAGTPALQLPTSTTSLNSPAVIVFNGGTQGFDGSTTASTWATGGNTLRLAYTGMNVNNPVQIHLSNSGTYGLDGTLPNGTNAITSPFTFFGAAGGDPTAGGTDKNIGRVVVVGGITYNFVNGLSFGSGALQVQDGTGQGTINGPINFLTGANVGFQGRGTSGTISATETSALRFGTPTAINSSTSVITIASGATAAMDVRLRTDQVVAHGIQVYDKTNILAGGTLKFTQSFAAAAGNQVGWVEVQGDIVGNGTSQSNDSIISLAVGQANTAGPFTNVNGVTFDNPGATGADLIVNGSGFGGLTVTASPSIIRTSVSTQGSPTYLYGPTGATDPVSTAAKVSNLLTAARLAALTGTGGYLTPAPSNATWNFPAGGEWSNTVPVGLNVSHNNLSGTGADVSLSLVSGSGSPTFVHNIAVQSGATLDTGSNAITLGPTTATAGLGLVTGVGTISGTAGITIAAGGAVAPGLGSGVIGNLNVSSTTLILDGNLQIDTGGASNSPSDELVVAGNLTINPTASLSLPELMSAPSNSATPYVVATYTGALTGTFGNNITGLAVGYQVSYATPNEITLVYSAIPTNIWNGTISGAWNKSVANWQSPSPVYADGNIVQFDNTATGTLNVTIDAGNVSPAQIVVNNDGSHPYTITSTAGNAIIGTGALVKSGVGTVTFSGPNTFSGGTTINGGTVQFGSNNALPSVGSVIVNAGGTLATQTFSDTLADVTVSGSVTGTGTLTVNSLTLTNSPSVSPNLVLKGALMKNGTGQATVSGNIDLNGTQQSISVATGTSPELSLTGVISDGGITKSGNGTLVLANGTNSFTGGVAVSAGTLRVGTAGAVGTGNALSVTGTGTFDANNTAVTVTSLSGASAGAITLGSGSLNVAQATTTSFTGTISGTGGSLVKSLGGELDLGGADTFTGGLTVNGGSVRLNNATAAGTGTVAINSGGIVSVLSAATTFANPFTLNGGTLGNNVPATGASTISGAVTVTANSVLDAFDPITNTTTTAISQDLILTGALHGNGKLLISAIPTNPRDLNGVRLRGPVSDYSGTIEVQAGAKFELQSGVASGSPMGTGSMLLDAGTFTSATTGGTFPIVNLRNTTTASTSFGNNVVVAGSGSVLFNMLGTSNATTPLVTTMGTLKVGGAGASQTIDVASAAVVQTLQFGGVTAEGGTVTFSAGIPGNTNYIATDNLTLGAINEDSGAIPVPSTNIVAAGTTGTLTFSAGGGYTGSTTLSSGNLVVGGVLTSTTALNVSGGKLTFTGANLVNPTSPVPVNLSGGTINANGFTETFGVLSVSALSTAHLDFGTTGAISNPEVLQFANSSAAIWTGTIEIDDWQGLQTGDGTDQLVFGNSSTALTPAELSDIVFENPFGDTNNYTAQILSDGEVVPRAVVPEPGSLATLLSGLGLLAGLQRFRRRS